MILIQTWLGAKQWRRVRYGVVRQELQHSEHPDAAINVAAVIGGVLFAIMYMVEENAGIAAWHEAGAAAQHADAAMTVSVGLIVAFVAAVAIATAVLYFVGHVASCAMNGYLHIQMDEGSQNQEIRDVKRRQRLQRRQR